MLPQPHEFSQFAGRFSSLGNVHFVCIHKRDSLDLAETNALGISVTVITLHRDPFLGIKERMPKRTCHDACPASDAPPSVDRHAVMICRFSVAGFGWANLNAIGFFTVVAGHWKVHPGVFPLDDFDARTAWIACTCMKHRANHLALSAARTPFMIHDQYLLDHWKNPDHPSPNDFLMG